MQNKILILNGPNLNMLGHRKKEIYGSFTLDECYKQCLSVAKELNLKVEFKQSNHEGKLITYINNAVDKFDGIIINPAAYTHTSIAIRDALEIFTGAKIEIHISNIYKREDFRHKSLISDVVDSVITGLSIDSYSISLFAISKLIDNN